MASMQAAYLSGHGGNEVVVVGERPVPVRKRGEALIEISAGGLNRVDLYMRNSGAGITHTIPQVLGLDGVGRLVDADDGEKRFAKGDRVILHPAIGCGQCEFCQRGEHVLCLSSKYLGEHRDGTLSQFVCLPAENVFAAPAGFDDIEAAALCVAPITAWRMLFTKGQLKPWETVLIFGVGGAVSLSALQFAKMTGARAIVTSRDDSKLAEALKLGADAAINGRNEDVSRRVMALTGGRGVDLVIENVGEAVWGQALKSLVRGGRLITCGATSGGSPSADIQRMFIRQLQVLGSTHGTFEEFRQMLEVCRAGRFRPVIDSRFSLTDIHAAFNRMEQGEQLGKIGITLS